MKALTWIVMGDKPQFPFGEFQQILSSLLIKYGGLGITMPAHIRKVAHLASQIETQKLQTAMFPFLTKEIIVSSLIPLMDQFILQLHPSIKPQEIAIF